jgi:hypothetical protein
MLCAVCQAGCDTMHIETLQEISSTLSHGHASNHNRFMIISVSGHRRPAAFQNHSSLECCLGYNPVKTSTDSPITDQARKA